MKQLRTPFSFDFAAMTACFLCLSLTTVHAAPVDITDHLMSGNKLVQEKHYKEAAREYETAVQLDPQNADANLLLGLTLTNTGDLERAVQYTQASIKIRPSYSAYYNLGLIYANKSRYQDAMAAYQNALKLNPSSYLGWYQLGLVYSTDLQFTKAIEAYQKVIELNPKFAQAYHGLGSAYYWNGDLASAMAQVGKLKKLKLAARSEELAKWIKNKELKKAAHKAAAPPPKDKPAV
jgi:tetratricopeptide (TPR) repeat protein